MKKVNDEVGKWNQVLDTLTGEKKTCIAACETTSFSDIIVSTTTYPNLNNFIYTKESCIIAQKLVSTCEDARRQSLVEWYPHLCDQIEYLKANNKFCEDDSWDQEFLQQNNTKFNFIEFAATLAQYGRDNIAFVSLFMREPFAEVLAVNVDTTLMNFIGSLGGLLGLCMGFSFVTLAEILYYGIDTLRSFFLSSGGGGGKSAFSRRENRKIEASKVTDYNNKY